MDINDILKLNYSKDNIRKIDNYLSNTPKNSDEYIKALTHKLILSPKINESLREIYSYVPLFNTLSNENIVLICDTIMKLVLKANRLDEYEKYMFIKAKYSLVKDNKYLNYDKYIYYKALKNYREAILELKSYLSYDLTYTEKIKALEDIIDLAFETVNLDLFLEYKDSLINLYEEDFKSEDINELNLKEIILYSKVDIDKSVSLAQTYLKNNNLSKEEKIKASNIILAYLIDKEEYRKATILESEYSELVVNNNTEEAKTFINLALSLYEKTNNLVSINYYKDLLNNIKNKVDKPAKKEIYIIPEIIEESSQKEKKVVIKENVIETRFEEYAISKNNKFLRQFVHDLNKNLKFRDVLRDIGFLLEKEFKIVKFNLIYKANKYHLHTYKNTKVYDRIYTELPDSFITYSYNEGENLFLDKELLENNIDIFTKDKFINNFLASFTLKEGNDTLGTIEFLSDYDFLKENNNYELFILLCEMLSFKVATEIKNIKIKEDNNLKDYVISNFYFGIKKIIKDNIYLSPEAKRVFRLEEDIDINTFYSYLDSDDVNEYKDFIKQLKEEVKNNLSITYTYKKDNVIKHLKEIFYVYVEDNEYILVSVIIDETQNIEVINNTLKEAYTDKNSGFYNKNKLLVDLEQNNNKRFSLAIFSFSDIREYIDLYGYEFYLSFIKQTHLNTRAFFHNYYNVTYYLLDDYTFALIIVDVKDKRKEESLFKKFLNYLNDSYIELKYVVYPKYKMGVYLHTKEDKKEAVQMIDCAYNAYLGIDYEQINYYSYKNYRNLFKEKEKYVLIKENILNNQIKVSYTQLIDYKNQEVYGYLIRLNLPNLNVYEDEMIDILTRYDKLVLYHKYKMTALCRDIAKLYNEVKAYVEVISYFSKEVVDDKFSSFVLEQLNFFKIPPEVFSIVVDEYTDKLDLLTKHNIKIITKNFYDILNNRVNNLYLDLNKLDVSRLKLINDTLSNLNTQIYLTNVDKKTDLEYIKNADIKYICGQVYSKTYNILELIEKIKD